jgi:putative acetyltransferase
MDIRLEQSNDRPGIHDLLCQAFNTDGEARLVDALRDGENLILSLVAVEEPSVVGHVAFSPTRLAQKHKGLGLAPVAVAASHRRRGVADELIRKGIAECARMGYGFIVVLGDPNYYSRFGFQSASAYHLTDEYQGGEAFQVLELVAGSIPPEGGLVRYAEQFSTLAD